MFRDCSESEQTLLRDLSRDGYIYIGRSGVGLTNNFRKLCRDKGTVKAIEETAQYHDILSKALLELIAIEGPVWVSFERISEVLETEPLRNIARAETGQR